MQTPEQHRKSCNKHYSENRSRYRDRLRENRARIRAFVRWHKHKASCKDCGIRYPYYVMDFDHVRGDKKYSIGETGKLTSIAAVIREINKCDLICANCHRTRTFSRIA